MKHRLTVKIKKRFKKQLSKRFNPRNARSSKYFNHQKVITVECLFCKKYLDYAKKIFSLSSCNKCPFVKFENELNRGCIIWIYRIMGLKKKENLRVIQLSTKAIYWNKHDNKKAIELLKKLREKAKKYIIWTENTK